MLKQFYVVIEVCDTGGKLGLRLSSKEALPQTGQTGFFVGFLLLINRPGSLGDYLAL